MPFTPKIELRKMHDLQPSHNFSKYKRPEDDSFLTMCLHIIILNNIVERRTIFMLFLQIL